MRKAKFLMVIVAVLYIFGIAVYSVYGISLSDSNLTEGNGSLNPVKNSWLSESEKKAYEEAKGRGEYKSKIIATYGKLPELKTEDQKQKWFNNLSNIMGSIRDRMDTYIYPNGSSIGYGYNYKGYMEVTFIENLTIEKTLMDEIYVIIDNEAKKRGIQEVPVEFTLGSLPQLDVMSSSQNGEIITTPQINKTNSIQPDESSKEKSVPFPELPDVLIVLFTGWLFIRQR